FLTKLDLSFSTINYCILYLISFLAYFVAPSAIMPDGSSRSDSTGYKWPGRHDIIESQYSDR
ncbi:MAG: hypothetical protein V7L14_26585, partial [Nostoc sp.]|uniref:hypothetical protein n=1 Tax=Nostoc sp. TaxID=1180 RepID=UPI002FFAF505